MSHPSQAPSFPVVRGRLPLLGHFHKVMQNQHAFLTANEAKHGTAFWMHSGPMGGWQLVVGGEDALGHLKNRTTSSDAFPDAADYIVTDTVLPSDGPEHKRMRGSMHAPFTPKGLTAGMAGDIVAEVVDKRIANWGRQSSLKIVDEAGDITLNVIFRLIGVPAEELPAWRDKYHAYLTGTISPAGGLPGSPRWRGLRARGWLDAKAAAYSSHARHTHDTDSFLGGLVHGHDDDGNGLSEAELFANLRFMGLAGHETTASTLSWAMLLMGMHPAVWRRLVDEATAHDAPVTPKDLAAFPFAEAVFREALRLYPPLSTIIRRTTSQTDVGGQAVPEGVDLAVSVWSLSRDASVYVEPNTFRPQRWLDLDRKPGPTEAFQFGGGPHFCLGYHLALLEGVSFLVRVAKLLSSSNKRPIADALPKPNFVPITRPPRSTTLQLTADATAPSR